MKPPSLTPLRLPIKNQDERISPLQKYLVKYGGEWIVGWFSKSPEDEDWEWLFSGIYDPGVNVDDGGPWQAVFEFKETK